MGRESVEFGRKRKVRFEVEWKICRCYSPWFGDYGEHGIWEQLRAGVDCLSTCASALVPWGPTYMMKGDHDRLAGLELVSHANLASRSPTGGQMVRKTFPPRPAPLRQSHQNPGGYLHANRVNPSLEGQTAHPAALDASVFPAGGSALRPPRAGAHKFMGGRREVCQTNPRPPIPRKAIRRGPNGSGRARNRSEAFLALPSWGSPVPVGFASRRRNAQDGPDGFCPSEIDRDWSRPDRVGALVTSNLCYLFRRACLGKQRFRSPCGRPSCGPRNKSVAFICLLTAGSDSKKGSKRPGTREHDSAGERLYRPSVSLEGRQLNMTYDWRGT